MRNSIKTRTALVTALLALAGGCAEMPDDELELGESEQALDNGTYTTTLFPEVVQIQIIADVSTNWLGISSTTWGNCTATAIADDLLITASHCVKKKDGTTVASNVKILNAYGENASADDAYSSYIIMSQDIYANIDKDDENDYYWRDFAFIKFGKGTFDRYFDFTYKTNKVFATNTWLTNVGYGDASQAAYGTTKVTYINNVTSTSDYGYFKTQSDSNTDGQGVTENGDSGGPLLYQENGKYYVVGVLFGGSTSGSVKTSYYPALTPAVYNHISTAITSMDNECVSAHKNADWDGDASALCRYDDITADLEAQGFYDSFAVYQKWYFDDWNDKFTSLAIPDDVTVTLFQNSGGGGDSVTFTTAFPFLDQNLISSLSPWDFNDRTSSYSVVPGSSPTLSLKSVAGGGCIDVAGGGTTNGTKLQEWSCQSGNNNQVWTLVATTTTNVYQLKSSLSGKCMNVTAGITANGTQLQQYDCSASNTDNLFRFEAQGDLGRFRMVHVASGKCVDVQSGASANGTKVQLYSCSSTSSNEAQMFTFKDYY